MTTIRNLLAVAVFAIGAFKTVCIVDGCVCLKCEVLRLELRVTDADEKLLPPHTAVVIPAGKS